MFEEIVTPYFAAGKTVHQVSQANHRALLTKLAKVTKLAKRDLMERNPFKPSAGSNPPFLVGRAELVDEFIESIIVVP
ncbi:MAG: hypothetical protein LBK28_01215 [Propionibacteriaceae bacterium]|nr:hypothetical protein [Propionibacteriaceae bacterium]